MANEAVLIFETETPIPFTVANGSGIERGALLALTDPMTVAGATAVTDICGGIAAEEKIASDGHTKISVYRGGIFRVFASGAVPVGSALGPIANSTNYVANLTSTTLTGARVFGIALETAATGESFLMELRPQTFRAA